MTQRTKKLHGTLTFACLGLLASMAGCIGDDSSEPPPHEAGTADHAVTPDSPTTTPDTGSPRPDSSTSPDTSVTPDAGRDSSSTLDGGRDSGPEASTADARDSAPEASRESGPDSNPPVEAGGDVRVDQVAEAAPQEAAPPEAAPPEAAPPEAAPPEAGPAEAAPPEAGPAEAAALDATPDGAGSAQLHMCQRFDANFGTETDAAACQDMSGTGCPDRPTAWAAPMSENFIFGPVGNDCHIAGIFTAAGADVFQFLVDLPPWELQFFGCPDPDAMTPVPPAYGLVISGLPPETVLTTADLRLLSDYWVAAINTTLSGASQPMLTQTETDEINARLDVLAAQRPNTVQASTYTFENCGDGG